MVSRSRPALTAIDQRGYWLQPAVTLVRVGPCGVCHKITVGTGYRTEYGCTVICVYRTLYRRFLVLEVHVCVGGSVRGI